MNGIFYYVTNLKGHESAQLHIFSEKLQKAIVEREIVDYDETGYSITDPLFEIWFKRTMM